MAARSNFFPKFQIAISHLFLDRFEQNLHQNDCFDKFFSLKGFVVECCVLIEDKVYNHFLSMKKKTSCW